MKAKAKVAVSEASVPMSTYTENIEFFEALAENTMISIASKESPEKIFMIQLPKPERALEALDIIKNGLKTNKN